VLEKDELVHQLAENGRFLAQYSFYPLKIDKKIVAVEILGEKYEEIALRAVINGINIDTSKSIDLKTKELLIYDIESSPVEAED
jgi:hypothetical protein